MTGVTAPPLFAPPPDTNDPRETTKGIGVWRFPEWFVVQEANSSDERERSRRLVHRKALNNKGGFDARPVVATRFVRACPKGHVDDLDWQRFVHGIDDPCRRQLAGVLIQASRPSRTDPQIFGRAAPLRCPVSVRIWPIASRCLSSKVVRTFYGQGTCAFSGAGRTWTPAHTFRFEAEQVGSERLIGSVADRFSAAWGATNLLGVG
jgi:hypothetical protein